MDTALEQPKLESSRCTTFFVGAQGTPMRLVVKVIKALRRRAAPGDRAKAKAFMNAWSLQGAEQSPLAGFAGMDC
ncbi:g5399 [Coccomyxa elongata]